MVRTPTQTTTAAGQALLDVQGVVNRFGPQTVHDGVSLQVQAGEIIALVGGSGTGKSVLLRTMTGLHKPDEGQVLIDGQPTTELHPRQRAMTLGVLFQQGALFSGLTVLENVMAPLREFTRLDAATMRDVARMKLALAGLPPEAADKAPAALSGGMIKRASLARAMALDPRILFLDEPTAGLDPIAAAEFDSLVRELSSQLGLTIVMITHDLDTLFTTAQRIAVLVDKRITVGTVEDMLASTHPWIHDYFHGERSRAAMTAAGQQATQEDAR